MVVYLWVVFGPLFVLSFGDRLIHVRYFFCQGIVYIVQGVAIVKRIHIQTKFSFIAFAFLKSGVMFWIRVWVAIVGVHWSSLSDSFADENYVFN